MPNVRRSRKHHGSRRWLENISVEGVLDFSLIGILSEISKVLADNKIGIFVVSTYNTDYILVKKENLQKAQQALKASGYEVA